MDSIYFAVTYILFRHIQSDTLEYGASSLSFHTSVRKEPQYTDVLMVDLLHKFFIFCYNCLFLFSLYLFFCERDRHLCFVLNNRSTPS